MRTLSMTVSEYSRWRAALPRDPFGFAICPPVVVMIVSPAEIAPSILAAARLYAAQWRS